MRVIRALVFLVVVAIGSIVVVGATGGARVAQAPAPTAAPSPSPTDATSAILADLSERGLNCVECYLFWNTNSGEMYVPPPSADPVAAATWLGIDLVAADGTTVRLSDFAGRPMLIELMATWCGNCADQQDTLRAARASLPADTVIVSLDVDPASAPGSLAPYASARGYDWLFAPSPIELSRALQAQFGDVVLNPAATPIVVVDRTGVASLSPLGHKDAEALIRLAGG
jgi:thiol-disulfide isomerase/thioredoxin